MVRFLQRRGGNSASVRVFRFVAVKVGDWASGEGWILPVAKDFEPWMMNPVFRSKIVEVYVLRMLEVPLLL